MKHALVSMHLAVLLWGFTGVLGRAISLDAPVLVWYRLLMTAGFMAVILYFRKQWVPVPPRDRKRLILIGCLIGLHWVAFYGSVKFANASIALICLSTASIFVSLLDPLVNRTRYNIRELMLGMLAIVGVYLIYRFQTLYIRGIVWGLVAAVLSAVFTVLNKKIAGKYPVRLMVFYEMAAGWGLVSLVIVLVMVLGLEGLLVSPGNETGHMSFRLQPADWIWLPILSLCCTVWAQSLALSALQRLSAFTVTLSVNMEPVYGILLAFVCYQENRELHWGFFAGMGLICLSVVLQMLSLVRRPALSGNVEKGD